MKVLIACEFSGIVREAFAGRGHDVCSCDLLPSEIPGNHYQGEIQDILNCEWDMIIAHPPCTYLANSGVRWLTNNFIRIGKMYLAHDFFMLFYNHPCEKICIENPIPHKHAALPKYTQIIQPWMFGEDASKSTCLWLKGLPKLIPTNIILKHRYANQTASGQNKIAPSDHRAKDRSRTFIGIAEAMSFQWG